MLIKGVHQIVGRILFKNAKIWLIECPLLASSAHCHSYNITHPNFLIMEILCIVSFVLSTSEAEIFEHIEEITP
jgi:hypothetical protein